MATRFKCEFAAGQDGVIFSGVWRVWSARNHPDLYLAATGLSASIKASIHQPRPPERPLAWRSYSFNSDARGSVVEAAVAAGGRHRLPWHPVQLQYGYTLEWRVIIPCAGMLVGDRQACAETKLLAPPAPGTSLLVCGGLGPPGDDAPLMPVSPRMNALSEGRLCDGTRVWLQYVYVPQDTIRMLAPERSARMPGSRDELIALARTGALRAVLYGNHPDGSLLLLDTRVGPAKDD